MLQGRVSVADQKSRRNWFLRPAAVPIVGCRPASPTSDIGRMAPWYGLQPSG